MPHIVQIINLGINWFTKETLLLYLTILIFSDELSKTDKGVAGSRVIIHEYDVSTAV